jgi:predicted transglutaminase-like cysteine proteinase
MNLLNYSFDNFHFTEVDFTKDKVSFDYFYYSIEGKRLGKLPSTFENITQEQKLTNISLWVYANITYLSDNNITSDYWQTPEETLLNRTGDCEDFAILIIGIAYSQLNIKMSLILMKTEDNQSGHAVACYDNNIYEFYPINYVQYCEKYNYILYNTILFDNIINIQCLKRNL